MEKKTGKRHRVLEFTDNDWYVTGSDARFPIKVKPMVFADLHAEFNSNLSKVTEQETMRTSEDPNFSLEEYTKVVNDYLEDFYNIVITVTDFNGYKVDKEFIKLNMGYDDPYWYIQSVSLGRPVYCIEDYEIKKKK